jgi:hypothetical protein
MRLIFYNSFCCFKLKILLCILCISFSCSTEKIKNNENIRFALINNTLGESPYSGLGPKVKPVIKKINDENPVFLAHLGSMVCGGAEWYGITKIDIERQYSDLYSEISALLPIFYTVKGEPDLFNNSSDYYMKYSGKKEYYSFNYGNLHFLVLDSTGKKSMSLEQKEWIKKDLRQTKNSGAIFVFIHDPLFFPVKFKSSEIEICKDFDLLHQYFTQYHIKAVFSGYRSIYFKMEVDGVLYINAGCGGFNANDLLNGYYQYYIADYKNGELNVQPRYVSIK